MLSQPNQWVEQWHVLRPDADFRDITKSSEDTPQASRSVEDDGETSDEDDQTTLGNTSTTKPILVVPGGDDDDQTSLGETSELKPVLVYPGEGPLAAVNQGFHPGSAATFPRPVEKKVFHNMDDYEFRALTKENTKINMGSTTSLRTAGGKKVSVPIYVCLCGAILLGGYIDCLWARNFRSPLEF